MPRRLQNLAHDLVALPRVVCPAPQLTRQLIEMEREAEVAQAQEESCACSPETAQARGRALLNLRVDDVEGGLLGRTLISLVSNKVLHNVM